MPTKPPRTRTPAKKPATTAPTRAKKSAKTTSPIEAEAGATGPFSSGPALVAAALIQRWFRADAERRGKPSKPYPPLLEDTVLAEPLSARIFHVRHELTVESDRGCVLFAAAHLDEELKKLLRDFMVESCPPADELLKSSGPLGAFSVRIDTCQALGLLPAEACRELHLVRKIRNEFAHVAEPMSFAIQSVVNRCTALTQRYHWLVGDRSPRNLFTAAVMGLSGTIMGSQKLASRRTPPVPPHPALVKRNTEFARQLAVELNKLTNTLEFEK